MRVGALGPMEAVDGDRPAARPNPPGDEQTFTLPRSGIVVHLPTGQVTATDASDTRKAVAPDVPFSLSASDFFAGRDPALELALAGTRG